MRTSCVSMVLMLLVGVSTAAGAQVAAGLGGGVGVGSRGGTASGAHADAFVEAKLPVLPALRADALVANTSGASGKLAVVVSGVLAAPVPVITPYALVGWGSYGFGGGHTRSGWNVGLGARAALAKGPALYAEWRRHQRIARDLFTIGLRF